VVLIVKCTNPRLDVQEGAIDDSGSPTKQIDKNDYEKPTATIIQKRKTHSDNTKRDGTTKRDGATKREANIFWDSCGNPELTPLGTGTVGGGVSSTLPPL